MKVYFDNEGITSQQFNILRILRGAGVPYLHDADPGTHAG